MTLFLASEAKHPQTLETLRNYIGGFKGKSIAYIPTAANGMKWGMWKEGGTWDIVQKLGTKNELILLEDYGSHTVSKLLQGKDIIWFAGGMCGYLMYWIRRCELDKSLPEILDSHTLYFGSSAGAMVAGKSIEISEWAIGDAEIGASIFPGLGLTDFNIYPHFEDQLQSEIEKLHTRTKLYLLKNGEEIIVEDKKVQIIGEERIII